MSVVVKTGVLPFNSRFAFPAYARTTKPAPMEFRRKLSALEPIEGEGNWVASRPWRTGLGAGDLENDSDQLLSIPLRRYLWWQHIPNKPGHKDRGDTRFSGGFGIHDAPEPWGPWTTVYFTEQWDVGPGERAEFPTKWMSEDGKTLYLVFSGDDNFSIRRATLHLEPAAK